MIKWAVFLTLMIICGISAGNQMKKDAAETSVKQERVTGEASESADTGEIADGSEEETAVDANNRTMLAKTMGVEENSRNLRFILSSLNVIGAGQIQSAEMAEIDGETVVDFVAEDGTNYRMYLSERGSVEAIENLDTGEWPVKSEK